MQEDAGRGDLQNQPGPNVVFVFGGGDDECFADETAGQRHAGNRQRADRPEDHREGHRLVETTQLGAFAFAGAEQHGSGGHPQQRLVNNVAKGVRDDAGDGEFGADAHAADHEANLVDDAVGENAAHVVFQQGINDAVNGHHAADRDKNLPAGETTDQRVNGGLGGVRAEDDPAHDGRFRIGIRQPTGERYRRRVDQNANQNEPASDCVFWERVKRDRAGFVNMEQNTSEQNQAAGQVDQDVALGGLERFLRFTGEDKERGRDGHQFPADVPRDHVTGEHHAQRAANVNQGGGVLCTALFVPRKNECGDRTQCENITKRLTGGVHPEQGEFETEQRGEELRAVFELEDGVETKRGQGDGAGLACRCGEQ